MSNQSPSQARGTTVASSLDSYDTPEAIQELNSIDLDGGKEQQLEHILLDPHYYSLLSQQFHHAPQNDVQLVRKVFTLFDKLDVQFLLSGANDFLLEFMLKELQLNEPPKEAVRLAILTFGVSLQKLEECFRWS
ncbi:hypothetical protein BD769DRAFT_1391934 [Suillus cothurnatus]|nr:hypothetical protein BD769DRAFT_1391934 [Suillus cothurnatus]